MIELAGQQSAEAARRGQGQHGGREGWGGGGDGVTNCSSTIECVLSYYRMCSVEGGDGGHELLLSGCPTAGDLTLVRVLRDC